MQGKVLKIGTRDSKLALWQAQTVKDLLAANGIEATLVPVKSEGDLDLVTPLYAMGVEGVFTKTLDAYLLSNKIDLAVHSMKDVPTQLAQGIVQAAVLKRANYQDLFVYKEAAVLDKYFNTSSASAAELQGIVATGSVRRKAQLLHRFPQLQVEALRGNVQTRMRKLQDNNWDAAIFAAAGLERINERPEKAKAIEWMLPAPAQGAIMIVCRAQDNISFENASALNHPSTAACVKIERDFLSALMGGCSTPISALAVQQENNIIFKGNILSLDGKKKLAIEKTTTIAEAVNIGKEAANELLQKGALEIVQTIKAYR